MTDDKTLPRALRTAIFAVLTLLFIFPVVWTLASAIKETDILFARPPKLLFTPISDHFREVFSSDSGVVRGVVNSIVVAGVSTLLVILIGTPAAYALARLRPRGRDDMMLFVLGSRMAPPVALIIPFFL